MTARERLKELLSNAPTPIITARQEKTATLILNLKLTTKQWNELAQKIITEHTTKGGTLRTERKREQ